MRPDIVFWSAVEADGAPALGRAAAIAIGAEARTRSVLLSMRDADQTPAVSMILTPMRVRRLIGDLQEALRHLED